MGKKCPNDKFYTKEDTARECINLINLSDYDTIIEPSAGNGSFSNNINHKNLLSFDISPDNDKIKKQDWLEYKGEGIIGKTLVVGNPPFGICNDLTFKFINKSDELEIDTIAFIVSKGFNGDHYKNRMPKYYHLRKSINLPENIFIFNGKDYKVRCCFQIWDRKDIKREKIIYPKSDQIEFLSKEQALQQIKKSKNNIYSLRMKGCCNCKTGRTGEIKKGFDILNTNPESHYYIITTEKIINIFKNYDFNNNEQMAQCNFHKQKNL